MNNNLKTMRCYSCEKDFNPKEMDMHQLYVRGTYADTMVVECNKCFNQEGRKDE